MADTRTIYLHTGIETFSSDPSDSQFLYLDMSDYDNLNPQYQSTIKLSSGVAGIYESTKAKITLTFKGENSGRDARADWVNKYAERINKISVNTTENKSAVFNKSAVVSEVEFIDTPYIDGAQVIIEVTMFGRWQSALTVLDTISEKYEDGTKAYLGNYYPEGDWSRRNYIVDTANQKTQISNGNESQDLYDSAKFYSPLKNWGIANGDYIISFDWSLKSALSSDMQASVIFNNSPWQYQNFTVNSGQLSGHVELKFKLNPEMLNTTDDVTGLTFRITSQMASGNAITYSNLFMKSGTTSTTWTPAPEDVERQRPHYNYNYTYGKTTLQNQIALPKDRNRFMLAIDSQYSVATITLSANGKRATISTSRLSANSSLSSDFVAYDITAFVDTDKFLLLNSGLVASVVWDNLASQYAVLYQIMNSVGNTPADISVTTTGGQHIPFKLYTYSIQDFI